MNQNNKCKSCRRLGIKLFLKGERCLSQKCAMIKRPYPPGQKRKRKSLSLSEYNKELRERQKLKKWYNLNEAQLRKYLKEVLKKHQKKEDPVLLFIECLESRLDNVILKLGFASSRNQARQLISHNYFLVNKKPVNIPSFQVKKGDVISLKTQKLKKTIFQDLLVKLKKQKIPSWLKLNFEKLEAEVINKPSFEEASPPVEISSIFEYYLK